MRSSQPCSVFCTVRRQTFIVPVGRLIPLRTSQIVAFRDCDCGCVPVCSLLRPSSKNLSDLRGDRLQTLVSALADILRLDRLAEDLQAFWFHVRLCLRVCACVCACMCVRVAIHRGVAEVARSCY